MTLIAENQEVKIYHHNTVSGQINVYPVQKWRIIIRG